MISGRDDSQQQGDIGGEKNGRKFIRRADAGRDYE